MPILQKRKKEKWFIFQQKILTFLKYSSWFGAEESIPSRFPKIEKLNTFWFGPRDVEIALQVLLWNKDTGKQRQRRRVS